MNPTTKYSGPKYSGQRYALDAKLQSDLTRLEPWRSAAAVALAWGGIALLVITYLYVIPPPWRVWLYFPVGFLIAGRMGALLQLIHEASHNLLHPNRRWNARIARWLCAYPLCVMYDGYVTGHRRHHAWTGTEKDPPADTEKYRVTDARSPKLYALLVKDFFGITALSVFAKYGKSDADAAPETPTAASAFEPLLKLLGMALAQGIVFYGLFRGSVAAYLFLWAAPAASFHMVLMRVRGIAEHGLARQLDAEVTTVSEGTFFTRSFLTSANRYAFPPLRWAEKVLIGSFSVHYHHEHHLFPNVPFYRLGQLHAAVADRVNRNNPHAYAKGYFSAALFNLFHKDTDVHLDTAS